MIPESSKQVHRKVDELNKSLGRWRPQNSSYSAVVPIGSSTVAIPTANFQKASTFFKSSVVPRLHRSMYLCTGVVIFTLMSLAAFLPSVPLDYAGQQSQLEAALGACSKWQHNRRKGVTDDNVVLFPDSDPPVAKLWALPIGWAENSCTDDQWLFKHIRAVLGVDLRCTHSGGSKSIHDKTSLLKADVFLLSYIISQASVDRFLNRYPERPRMFITYEVYDNWIHHLLHRADSAVGSRLESEVLIAYTTQSMKKLNGDSIVLPPGVIYRRIPIYIVYLTSPGTCRFCVEMDAENITAEEWAARPRFATIIARHAAYPRGALFGNLSNKLGMIDAPSKAFHNMEWDGINKVDFVRQRRWIITPENILVDGYISEKIFHAHSAGAIPIWWGQASTLKESLAHDRGEPWYPEVESEVLNSDRILILRDGPGINPAQAMQELLSQVDSIERDVPGGSRAHFFNQLVFRPGYQAAMKTTCDGFIEVFCAALKRPAERKTSTLVPGLFLSLLLTVEDFLDMDIVSMS